MGWISGYQFLFDYNARNVIGDNWHHESDGVALYYEMSLAGFRPLRPIAAGETYVSPKVHMGAIFGTDGCLIGSKIGPEQDMSLETSKRFADQMKALGAEYFYLDAGWYCPPSKEMEWRQ